MFLIIVARWRGRRMVSSAGRWWRMLILLFCVVLEWCVVLILLMILWFLFLETLYFFDCFWRRWRRFVPDIYRGNTTSRDIKVRTLCLLTSIKVGIEAWLAIILIWRNWIGVLLSSWRNINRYIKTLIWIVRTRRINWFFNIGGWWCHVWPWRRGLNSWWGFYRIKYSCSISIGIIRIKVRSLLFFRWENRLIRSWNLFRLWSM